MINCKKHFIAACFSLIVPTLGMAEAPVVDDSDNFAIIDEQHAAVRPQYEEIEMDNAEVDSPRSNKYQSNSAQDDGPALARDDTLEQNPRAQNYSQNAINKSAALIERVHTLQKEVQELRGQLEVQAHELKTLKEQQLTYYKDLDGRIANASGKSTAATQPVAAGSRDALLVPSQTPVNKPRASATYNTAPKNNTAALPTATPGFRSNPADEQISYLAAYELVKNKQYDNAIKAMQTFVQKYPQGGYSANAQYWLGELFMVKKDYAKAIEHFEVVLHQFPSSNKTAASMLKAGYAYAASGNNQEAKKRLQEVVKTFPGTQTAQLAHLKLESINAT